MAEIATADEDYTSQEPQDSKKWLDLIKDATSHFSKYEKTCDSIDKLYADLETLSADAGDREFQIFWANLEVLKPSIYSRPPRPVVTPRFKKRREAQLSREAAEVLQRVLETEFDIADINDTMLHVRDDLALSARGVAWMRLKSDESLAFDHVDRCDFLHDPARKWAEVDWVARRAWLNREQGLNRFGDVWLGAEFTQNEAGKDNDYKGDKKAAVWEIWHKSLNVVVWVTQGVDSVLDQKPPFLSLDGFFPCPKPAYGTTQRRSMVPVPDFVYYKDQVEEINELTARISALAEGLRLKGFYASGQEDLSSAIERAIQSQSDNAILIPVPNHAAMGGQALKDAIVWLPIAEVVATVQSCIELRKQLIDDVYQITGLSDIMRGATDPNETLGAQELKSQYGNVRVRDRQAELVRIARDLTRMAGEIMAENYSPETLLLKSQIEMLTAQDIEGQRQQLAMQVQQAASNPQIVQMAQDNPEQAQQIKQQIDQQLSQLDETITIDKIVELFRSEKVRSFVLDIETDSTIQPDENAEKQARSEFVTAVGGFLSQSAPMVMQAPETGPFIGEMLKFVAAPFRAGRELEAVIDDFAEQISQRAQQPKGPSPEEIKAKAEQEARAQEFELKKAQHEADMAMKQMDMDAKREEYALKANTEKMKFANEVSRRVADKQRLEMDREDREAERGFKAEQRKGELAGKMVDSGLPPDYSFEDDRKQFAAIMDEMRASRESQAQMMQLMMQQTQAIVTGMMALAKAQSSPRSVKKQPDGSYSMQFEAVN